MQWCVSNIQGEGWTRFVELLNNRTPGNSKVVRIHQHPGWVTLKHLFWGQIILCSQSFQALSCLSHHLSFSCMLLARKYLLFNLQCDKRKTFLCNKLTHAKNRASPSFLSGSSQIIKLESIEDKGWEREKRYITLICLPLFHCKHHFFSMANATFMRALSFHSQYMSKASHGHKHACTTNAVWSEDKRILGTYWPLT